MEDQDFLAFDEEDESTSDKEESQFEQQLQLLKGDAQ